MNKPSAISGTFVALTPVASRKVVRLHIECAIELANDILACLGGYPDPANPKHVAVAQLNIEAITAAQKVRRSFKDMPPASQAALTCKEPRFWAYLREEHGYDCSDESDAADAVRHFCKVHSRAELIQQSKEGHRWSLLASAFKAWEEAEKVGA